MTVYSTLIGPDELAERIDHCLRRRVARGADREIDEATVQRVRKGLEAVEAVVRVRGRLEAAGRGVHRAPETASSTGAT